MNEKPSRPVMRYHGGKWRLAPWIVSHFPPHRIYVEPFCGAASVLMRKERSYSEVINDLDRSVVNLFRVLRDPARAKDLTNLIRLTPYARDEFDHAEITGDLDEIERARRCMVRCWMAYSGRNTSGQGWRSNATRSGTTPAFDWARLPEALPAVAPRLRGVIIENRPAVDVIRRYDHPEALIYCDPPYVRDTRSSLRRENEGAYTHEMNDLDHCAMADALQLCSGMVLLSGYRCQLYDDMFAGWMRVDRPAIASGQKGGAVERTESLWINPAAMAAIEEQAHG